LLLCHRGGATFSCRDTFSGFRGITLCGLRGLRLYAFSFVHRSCIELLNPAWRAPFAPFSSPRHGRCVLRRGIVVLFCAGSVFGGFVGGRVIYRAIFAPFAPFAPGLPGFGPFLPSVANTLSFFVPLRGVSPCLGFF